MDSHRAGSLRLASWTTAGLAAAFVVGAYLRLQQLGAQVLIDDEWHAVHQVLRNPPARMFVDFGFADYSIPLGLYDWLQTRLFGLSEMSMRLPMLLCGLATLLVFPLYVARRLPRETAALFALLLAGSPLLVIYSRMARPYAITLLLGWIAHAAFQRYLVATGRRVVPGAVYVVAGSVSIWLHPLIGPFIVAPFLWSAVMLARGDAAARWRGLGRLAALAVPAGAVTAALVLPPLLANPQSLSHKGGIDLPTLDTAIGVWYAWLGTPSTPVVVGCLALAACGAGAVWRALPEARTAVLGLLLTLAAVMIARPMWSFNSIALGRYLLPVVPLLLLAVAAGAVRLARAVAASPTPPRRAAAACIALAPCVALAAQSPLAPLLRHPNGETQHFINYFDFRPERNPYPPHMEGIPLSSFWSTLAAQPAGSLRVAAAPFYFESYDWDAPRWERISGQAVVPGYLTGLCVDWRAGELPPDPAFAFANAVHLADDRALAQRRIDYVVWQKPYSRIAAGERHTSGAETAACEGALRARFGAPAFEDAALVAFRVAGTGTSSDARR